MSDDEPRRHQINLRLPDDCAVVTAELIAITYISDDGTSGYAVVTRGDMPMTTFLGLATLAEQNILAWGRGND